MPIAIALARDRMLSVPSALSCFTSGTPIVMPYCCCTLASDAVGSMRPNSSGGPS
jgi:hypothetical protein